MYSRYFQRHLRDFLFSRKALAIPVTYLILFVSLIAVISATYSFAIVKINARSTLLNASVAKQNMYALDDSIRSVAWSFGASEVIYMDSCGGTFKTDSEAKNLAVNFTDEQSFCDVVFNNSLGKFSYELEPSDSGYEGVYFRGDERAIINQSAFTTTQLYGATEDYVKAIVLCYRPSATVAVIGTSNGKPLNLIRVNVLNLNLTQNLALRESFYLKISSVNVTVTQKHYEFNQPISSLELKTVFDGTTGNVWLPISSNDEGAAVNLEIVVCNIILQKPEV